MPRGIGYPKKRQKTLKPIRYKPIPIKPKGK